MTTRRGRPAGDQTFPETMAQLTSRLLQKSKPGRPQKQKLQENGVMPPEYTQKTWKRWMGLCLMLFMVASMLLPFGTTAVSAPTGVIDLWGGACESIALRSDGTVWTWGWDDCGILGNGYGVTMFDTNTLYNSMVPFQVLGQSGVGHLTSIIAIAGGERHNAALDSNGNVWTWGWNAFGILGNGIFCSDDPHSLTCMGVTPAVIPGFTSVKAIASRGYHTLALKNDGTVWAWGYNDAGRLGDGTNVHRHNPVKVTGLTGHGGVVDISGGGDINAALMADHSLMAWGFNGNGAVGNGTTNEAGQWTPVQVSQTTGLTNVKAIATGWDHMVALAADGAVWTWGLNHYGQLGNGTTTNSSLPVKVAGLSNVVGVSAGDGSNSRGKSRWYSVGMGNNQAREWVWV